MKKDASTGSTLFRAVAHVERANIFPRPPNGACERHNLLEDTLGPVAVLATVVFHPTTTLSAHTYSIMRPELLTNKKFLGRLRGASPTCGDVRTFWHRRSFVVVDLNIFQLCDTDLEVPWTPIVLNGVCIYRTGKSSPKKFPIKLGTA